MRIALSIAIVVIVSWIMLAGGPPAYGCTSAVVAPEGSATGTPLLWKNRDTAELDNKVVYVAAQPHAYLCLANAAAASGRSCWAGLNDAGFAIMNTATYNVPSPAGEVHDREGIIMADALRSCRSVADFARYLAANLGPALGGRANFGVMDGAGGAALFEVHNHGVERFDAAAEPRGYLINTNFARTGDADEGQGYLRFDRATALFSGFPDGGVDPRVILHRFSRDLDNPLIDEPSLADAASFTAGEPVWVNSRDCIDRPLTASAVVLVGGDAETPDTMWVIPGEPLTAVAIPLWVEAGTSPAPLHEGELAPMWQASRRIKDHIRPSRRGHTADYLDLAKLDNADGTGYLPALLDLESAIFAETEAFLAGHPPAGELARFQAAVADRVLEHLAAVPVVGADEQAEADREAACDELVAAFETLAADSAGIEVRTVGRSASGEPIRVVEIIGGNDRNGAAETLGILLPCGPDSEALGDAFRALVDHTGLDSGVVDGLDAVLVGRPDKTPVQ